MSHPRLRLLVLAVVILASGVAGRSLSWRDEVRVAGIARAMVLGGDYLVPRLNGAPFLEYGPAGYWPAAITFRVLGDPGDLGILIGVACAGLATLALTVGIGRRLGDEATGLAAGLVLLTIPPFVSLHNKLVVDSLLLLWISVSLFGFVSAIQDGGRARSWSLFFAGMGFAFLTKGPIGIAIPGGVALAGLAASGQLRRVGERGAWIGSLWLVLPVAIWTLALAVSQGREMAVEVWRQSLFRFASADADHARHAFHYVVVLSYVALPWTLTLPFLPRVLGLPGQRFRHRLPAVWCVLVLVGLSLASAKRTLYLAPFYPGFALWVAVWWRAVREGRLHSRAEAWLAQAVDRFGWTALALYVAGLCAFQLFVARPERASEDLRPFMQAAQALPVEYVLGRNEGLHGAVTLYWGRTVPTLVSQSDADLALATRDSIVVLSQTDDVEKWRERNGWQVEILAETRLGEDRDRRFGVVRIRRGSD